MDFVKGNVYELFAKPCGGLKGMFIISIDEQDGFEKMNLAYGWDGNFCLPEDLPPCPQPTPEELCFIYRDELNNTDKYVIRELETGKPCPTEIHVRRAWLRSEINRLEEKENDENE